MPCGKTATYLDLAKLPGKEKYFRAESDTAMASHIVGGGDGEDAAWVKNTMKRLEVCFDQPVLRKIRKNCQCGCGLEEWLAFIKVLKQGV